MRRARSGFTLIELLMVAVIMGVLAALSISLMRPGDEERVQGAVRVFARDVEWARSATLTNPDDPVSIHLATDGTGWLVSRNSAPDTPLTAADGSVMRRTMGSGISEAAAGVQLTSFSATQRQIEFEPFGGVRTSPAYFDLILPDSGTKCRITFESGTGNIQTSWSNP